MAAFVAGALLPTGGALLVLWFLAEPWGQPALLWRLGIVSGIVLALVVAGVFLDERAAARRRSKEAADE